MRVLRLDLPGAAVSLHPFVSVVRGLTPVAREALLAALSSVPKGAATTTGMLEAHGVLLDLDPESLAMLDLRTDLDTVVRTGDLPGVSGGARLREAQAALAEAEAESAAAEHVVSTTNRALEAAREALALARADADRGEDTDVLAGPRIDLEDRTRALEVAERTLRDAVAAEQAAARRVIEADATADAARLARAEATIVVAAAAAALDIATEQRDPVAAATLEAARTRLADAEAAVVEVRAGENGEQAAKVEPPTDEELAALRAERLHAEAAVLALETGDPSPVRLALEQIRAGAALEPVPDPKALDIADRWGELLVELHQAGADDVDDDVNDDHAAARVRLASAEAALATAEESLRAPAPDPSELRALEAAHAEVLEAREAQDRRFRRGGADRRLADAEETERALLEQLGFATFTDYLLGQRAKWGDAGVGLDAARTELLAASAAADQIDVALAGELQRAELLNRRRALRAAAVELLGTDPGFDLVPALRRRRVPATETGGHLERLRSALEGSGLVFGDEQLPERTLVDLATVWLEEQERATHEREDLEQRIADLESRLAEANRLRALAAGVSGAAPSALAAGLAGVDQARAAVGVAEARLARHREAEAAAEQQRHALEEAAAWELRAISSVAAAESVCVDARTAEREAAAFVIAADADLAQARAAEAAAADLLANLEDRLASAGANPVGALEADVARVISQLGDATGAAARADDALERARRAVAAAETDELQGTTAIVDTEDAEWFLLARLAGQRAVSYAGSVPFVLDDALAGFDVEPTRRLLARLERMSATVQLVLVTEDLTTAAWAEGLGTDRAAIIQL